MKRKADGEYKLGPVSGMVRGLRYGEEDDFLDDDHKAEFDPNEIGDDDQLTQQEWGEISGTFFQPRHANDYSNGEREMKNTNRKATPLDNWEFAEDEDTSTGGAEGYFADNPYYRETREFAESGENTNDADIDPKASKNTPPTPDQIEQDDDVKTLGRVKIEELSVKQDKKASAIARLLSEWKLLGEE